MFKYQYLSVAALMKNLPQDRNPFQVGSSHLDVLLLGDEQDLRQGYGIPLGPFQGLHLDYISRGNLILFSPGLNNGIHDVSLSKKLNFYLSRFLFFVNYKF
jgi:hypothetical protein